MYVASDAVRRNLIKILLEDSPGVPARSVGKFPRRVYNATMVRLRLESLTKRYTEEEIMVEAEKLRIRLEEDLAKLSKK